MKAIVFPRYGGPEVLRLEDVEKPIPGDDEVLVRVHATALNPLDWRLMRGEPYLIRGMTGLFKPKPPRLGVDASGVVEAAGRNVKELAAGDAVFGAFQRRGTLAEYACAPVSELAHNPANASFEQAATLGVAAITALQALRDHARIAAGQKVLVNGAAGGVGTFAIQIAKAMGAEATAVCSARNVELVRSLGARHAIDYAREDFTRAGPFDAIVDCIANRSLRDCLRALTPKGAYVVVGGPGGRWLGPIRPMIKASVSAAFSSRRVVPSMSRESRDDLLALKSMVEAGSLTPVIDRVYPLAQAAEALEYLEAGHARGKVVVTC